MPLHQTSPAPSIREHVDLCVIVLALNEAEHLARLLPELQSVLASLGVTSDVVVVTEPADRNTIAVAAVANARVVVQDHSGYGGALVSGFREARADYVLTLDADLSHAAPFIKDLWEARQSAEVVVASRYIPGGRGAESPTRRALSRALNLVFSRGLSLGIRDVSSGFRLYNASVLRNQGYEARGFDILQRILVEAYAEGWRIRELPFAVAQRPQGSSYARVLKFGRAYARTFWRLWKLRNSILAADYDDRAHDSPIWLQRYWQRNRHRHVTELIDGEGAVLDVGCGSSRIIGALPPGSVAMDILRRKLRHARKFGKSLVQASGFALPVRDESFSCVLCSQVIEHVPKESPILGELCRVLKPGGRLVLGTPDYANWQWVWMEKAYGLAAPGGYADEHISHYTYDELRDSFTARGFTVEASRYILRGELIMAFRKGSGSRRS